MEQKESPFLPLSPSSVSEQSPGTQSYILYVLKNINFPIHLLSVEAKCVFSKFLKTCLVSIPSLFFWSLTSRHLTKAGKASSGFGQWVQTQALGPVWVLLLHSSLWSIYLQCTCKMGIQLYFLSDGFYANTWVFSLYCMLSLLPSAFGSLFNPAVHLSIPNWCPRVDCWALCPNLAFCEASICTVLFHNFLSYSGNIYSSIETWASFH